MSYRPAKITGRQDRSVLLDSFGNVAWNLKTTSKETGKEVIFGNGPLGKRILRDIMLKHDLHFSNHEN